MGMIKHYENRKKLKWIGFFLSEHTTSVNKVEKERATLTHLNRKWKLKKLENFFKRLS
ncbi:hypothetical protein IGJ28_002312 [Enterococcus sp. AZ091]